MEILFKDNLVLVLILLFFLSTIVLFFALQNSQDLLHFVKQTVMYI